MINKQNLIEKAHHFAKEAHKNTRRKFSNQPYFIHPQAVAQRVAQFSTDPEIIAAAYLHDVVEDEGITIEHLRVEFGDRAAGFVFELTSDEEKIKKIGKSTYLAQKINTMTPQARLIKLADREDNVSDLQTVATGFQFQYAIQTDEILKQLTIQLTEPEKILIQSIRQKIQPLLVAKKN